MKKLTLSNFIFIILTNIISLNLNANIISDAKLFLNYKLKNQYDGKLEFDFGNTLNNINIRPCSKTIEFSLPKNGFFNNRATLIAHCDTKNGWKINLPFSIAEYKPIVVTKRQMSKNEILQKSDLYLKEIDVLSTTNSYIEDINLVTNYQLNYPVNAGFIITKHSISKPIIMRRGDLITISAESDGLLIKMQGIAQENASIGDNIKVKNKSSNKIISATVSSNNTAKIVL